MRINSYVQQPRASLKGNNQPKGISQPGQLKGNNQPKGISQPGQLRVTISLLLCMRPLGSILRTTPTIRSTSRSRVD